MRFAFLAVAALAAGCFGGLKEPVPQPLVYRISAPKLAAGAPLAAHLKVDVGQVAPGLDPELFSSELRFHFDVPLIRVDVDWKGREASALI